MSRTSYRFETGCPQPIRILIRAACRTDAYRNDPGLPSGEISSRRVLMLGWKWGTSMQDEKITMDTVDAGENLTRCVKEFAVVKRSVVVGGHKTSVSLEDAFWVSLKDIATRRGLALSTLIDVIDRTRKTGNLSSAIRLFVLDHFRARAVTTMFIGERVQSPSIAPAG